MAYQPQRGHPRPTVRTPGSGHPGAATYPRRVISDGAGAGGDRAPSGADPLEITAPVPVVVGAQEHPAAAPGTHEPTPGPDAARAEIRVEGDVIPAARDSDDSRRRRGLLAAAGATAAALALVGGLSYLVAGRGSASSPGAPDVAAGSSGATTPAAAIDPLGTGDPSTAPLPASQPTLVLGDSLGLVVYPWLADDLPDRYVSYAAEVGRSTAHTADALAALVEIPPVVIVSSGTNDPSAAEFAASAARVLATLGPQRCVVWVDVVRPNRVGDPQAQMNAALDAVVAGHSNVRVLRWSQMVAAHPEWMSGDGIHPGQDGAMARATAFAQASTSCSPLDPAAPRAVRQTLPASIFWGPVSGSNRHASGASGAGTATASAAQPTASTSPSASARTPTPSSTPSPSPTLTTPSGPAPSTTAPEPPTSSAAAPTVSPTG